MTRRITLDPPQVRGAELVVSWSVAPPSELYARERFSLRVPDSIDLGAVPEAVRWTVALLCLHSHWPLLRPCRVELPVTLPPGQREFWLRLCDAAVTTLESLRGTGDRARTIELADAGPPVAAVPAREAAGTVVTAFSGGKDSLLQLGLLTDLGVPVVAVTTTSPMPPLADHLTARRRAVLAELPRRRAVEHVEVHSDLRSAWVNDHARTLGYPVSVNELSDTFLYLASMLLVAWARGADRVLLASEAELQETVERDGAIVQHPHFMYGAVTQQALDALFAGLGMRHGSLTYPLRSGQVQRLLWTRYPDLRDLQYSCWRVGEDQATCSACSQCLRIALCAVAAGGRPADMGIDLPRLLWELRDWEPSPPGSGALPDDAVKASLHGQVVRDLHEVTPRRMARHLVGSPRRNVAVLRAYTALRRRVLAATAPSPAPGYRHGYLALVEPGLRPGLETILDASFPRAPLAEHADLLARTRQLAGWIAEPLGGTR